jgi:lipopolysaccharide transport system ATP-binding protein
LEVGTGFHPKLSERDNIFLNGAILGMNRREIRFKFDEIVGFAEIGAFIVTPIKRYSCGKYFRLAFAVAAHLEPDIWIVDEVLAVGDAQFQSKCLGKIRVVSRASGRTVLFVSHNMAAVKSLCTRAVWLQRGLVRSVGSAEKLAIDYLNETPVKAGEQRSDFGVRLLAAKIIDGSSGDSISHLIFGEDYQIIIGIETSSPFTRAGMVRKSIASDPVGCPTNKFSKSGADFELRNSGELKRTGGGTPTRFAFSRFPECQTVALLLPHSISGMQLQGHLRDTTLVVQLWLCVL